MARNRQTNIPNAYETIFSKESMSSRREYEMSQSELQDIMSKTAEKIESSKLDTKLKQMLQVQMKYMDSAKTSKQLEQFIAQYSKEAKLGKRQLKYLEDMKNELAKIKEVEQRSFQADLKYRGASFAGAKEAFSRGGVKGALSYSKTAMKTMSAGTMMKAGLHTAGVLTDSPALNLLAASLNPKKDERSYEASEEIRNILQSSHEESRDEQDDRRQTTRKTEQIANSNEEVVGQLKKANSTLSEMLFRQKDMADDVKVSATASSEMQDATSKATSSKSGGQDSEKDSDFGLFGDLFDKKKRGGLKSKAKGLKGLIGRGVGLVGGAMPVVGKLGVIGAAAGLGYGAYQGVSDAAKIHNVKEASLMQKITAGLGGMANMASFGMIDTGNAARGLQKGVDYTVDLGKYGIEKISSLFESGGRGAGTISSGRGDYGGKSYGTHQLSSRTGTLQRFLSNSPYGSQFRGLQPGSPQFDAKWKQLATSDPNFGKSQEKFIRATHYAPEAAELKQSGLDVSKRSKALQSSVYSTSVQFGGSASTIVQKAMKEAGLNPKTATDEQIIKAVQAYKRKYNAVLFKSSSADVRASTYQRSIDEESTLLKALAQERLAANVQPTAKPKSAMPSPALNTQTERALNKKQMPSKQELINYNELAGAVRAGVEGATVKVKQPNQKKMQSVPLEDSDAATSLKLQGKV